MSSDVFHCNLQALFQHQQQTIEEAVVFFSACFKAFSKRFQALAWEQHYLGSSGTLASNVPW